jgi:hypothetical protein
VFSNGYILINVLVSFFLCGCILAHSWPLCRLCLTLADEFATLCGSQRPGFVIDIYTGLPVGELEPVSSWAWLGGVLCFCICVKSGVHTHHGFPWFAFSFSEKERMLMRPQAVFK